MGAIKGVRRGVKEWGKRRLRNLFEAVQPLGFDVLPRHYYSEIPNIRALRREGRWRRPYSMAGVAGADIEDQLAWLREACPPALAERLASLDLYRQAGEANGATGYGPIDAHILYSVIYTRKPSRMVQVGAGAATWVALKAAEDSGASLDITCVDPAPTGYLKWLAAAGRITLCDVPVQELTPDRLSAPLKDGDVLFADSTHTVSPGSDTNFLILEVLPKLSKGVLVHFHDVTMPFDYSPTLLHKDLFFWSESVLLQAYLADNPRCALRLGGAMVHHAALQRVREIIPYPDPMPTQDGLAVGKPTGTFPSSVWLEMLADPVRRGSGVDRRGVRP